MAKFHNTGKISYYKGNDKTPLTMSLRRRLAKVMMVSLENYETKDGGMQKDTSIKKTGREKRKTINAANIINL